MIKNNFKKKNFSSQWPWSDIIILFNNYCDTKIKNILELGPGYGANIPFFLKKEFSYHSIEKNKEIHKYLISKYPSQKKFFYKTNFFKKLKIDKKFDLIFDRGSVTMTSKLIDIKNLQKNIKILLNTNGYYIGVDWYSNNTSLSTQKKMKKKFGNIYFISKNKIKKIFQDYEFINFKEKILIDLNSKEKKLSTFQFVLRLNKK